MWSGKERGVGGGEREQGSVRVMSDARKKESVASDGVGRRWERG
jgi:hypothetical protein